MQKIFEPDQMEAATLSKVRAKIRSMGLPDPEQPKYDIPEVPKNLLSRGGDFITELYRQLLAWYEFLLHVHGVAELQAKEWKNNVAVMTKKLVKDGLEEDKVDADQAVAAARLAMQSSDQEAELLKIRVSILDRRMKMVSRAITILEQEMEKSKRGGNIGAGKPWPFKR